MPKISQWSLCSQCLGSVWTLLSKALLLKYYIRFFVKVCGRVISCNPKEHFLEEFNSKCHATQFAWILGITQWIKMWGKNTCWILKHLNMPRLLSAVWFGFFFLTGECYMWLHILLPTCLRWHRWQKIAKVWALLLGFHKEGNNNISIQITSFSGSFTEASCTSQNCFRSG